MADDELNIDETHEELPLSKAAQYLLEECRTAVGGIKMFGSMILMGTDSHSGDLSLQKNDGTSCSESSSESIVFWTNS